MSLDELTQEEIDNLDVSRKIDAILLLGYSKNHKAYDFLVNEI